MEDDEDVLFGDGEEQLAALSDLEVSGEEEEEQEDAAGQPVGWRALRAKLQQEGQQEEQEQGDSSSSEGEEEGEEGDDKEARRAAMAEKRSQLQRLVEEYYKLDYEDNISGIPCRFRYKEVRCCHGVEVVRVISTGWP
jgi:protein KRI1